MKTKQIKPLQKAANGPANYPYVRINPKMLMINSNAMALWGETDYMRISISTDEQILIFSKAHEGDENAFKLSTVCETRRARRIETNRALLSIIKAGFPLYMIDKRLPVKILMDGSLAVDFSMKIPIKEAV